jgi:hypothetical protein
MAMKDEEPSNRSIACRNMAYEECIVMSTGSTVLYLLYLDFVHWPLAKAFDIRCDVGVVAVVRLAVVL